MVGVGELTSSEMLLSINSTFDVTRKCYALKQFGSATSASVAELLRMGTAYERVFISETLGNYDSTCSTYDGRPEYGTTFFRLYNFKYTTTSQLTVKENV